MLNTTKSEELYKVALDLMPGGVNSPVRAFGAVGRNPLFIDHAKGSYVYDVDGNKFIDNVVVGTVEGWPTLENAIDELRALGAKHIELRPMMLVAGDHAQNDMAGDDADSWKSHLTAAGFDVHCTVEGLGELEDVQRLYVEHLKAELK